MGLGAAAAFPLALGMHTAVVVCAIVSLVAAAVAAMTVAVTTWVEGDGSGDLPALVDHALSLIDTDEPTA